MTILDLARRAATRLALVAVIIAAIIVIVIVIVIAAPAAAQERARGITGRPAPELGVDEWFHLDEGRTSLEMSDLEGKVVYLFFFQSWCPGCHRHGFPTLQAVRERFEEDGRVAFVTVQTVFEGHGANTAERGRNDTLSFGLEDVPFGHAPPGRGERLPGVMQRYRTGGTPWTVIVGPDGIVRFDGFRIPAARAMQLVESLLPKPE